MKGESLNVRRNMWSTRGGKQSRCTTRHLACTMRVGIHQSQDGDSQRVPQLPHHQPAVHVRDAFTLERHHASCLVTRDSLSFSFFCFLATDSILRSRIQTTAAPTVIMMQGDNLVQKSSSSRLWNVASFSTMRTNLAEEAISAH